MTTYSLDELARALRSTLETSREKLDHKQKKRLSSVINMDRTGRPESMSWECRLPSGDGGEFNFELIRLPLASLVQTEVPDISRLSVEIDCSIRKNKRPPRDGQPELIATPITRKRADAHSHKIRFDAGRGQQETTIRIDGITVEEFIEEQRASEQPSKEPGRKKRVVILTFLIVLSLVLLAAVMSVIRGSDSSMEKGENHEHQQTLQTIQPHPPGADACDDLSDPACPCFRQNGQGV